MMRFSTYSIIAWMVSSVRAAPAKQELSYRGYWAKIKLDGDHFEITDNCGGIPSNLIRRAFGIGKTFDPDEPHRTIGVYGIGMKRAIFKMALDAKVESHANFGFTVRIDEKWMDSESNWRLEYRRARLPFQRGTRILISKLKPEIARVFASKSFANDLYDFISRQYAVIIGKGFRVELNTQQVNPAPIAILSADPDEPDGLSNRPVLAPYMLRFEADDVRVSLWVGMYRALPDTDSEEEMETEARQSSDNSGWTIICNDRAIVSNDRTLLTGWGEAGVPRFHPQFIGIRGIVVMESQFPLKLPLTTTKRGLDASSDLFLSIKEFMREGTKLFTNFTNHWKGNRDKVRQLFVNAVLCELPELQKLIDRVEMADLRKLPGAKRYQPDLPVPDPSPMKRISFLRHQGEIAKVGEALLGDTQAKPSDVGAACFDQAYRRTQKR